FNINPVISFFISGTIDAYSVDSLSLSKYNSKVFRMFSCYEEFIQKYKPTPRAVFEEISMGKTPFENYLHNNCLLVYAKYKQYFDNMMIYELSNNNFVKCASDLFYEIHNDAVKEMFENYVEAVKKHLRKQKQLFKDINEIDSILKKKSKKLESSGTEATED